MTEVDQKSGLNLIHVVNRVLFPPATLNVLELLEVGLL